MLKRSEVLKKDKFYSRDYRHTAEIERELLAKRNKAINIELAILVVIFAVFASAMLLPYFG